MRHWTKAKERGSLLGMKFLLFIYRFGGRFICKLLLIPIIFYFYLSNKAERSSINLFYTLLQTKTGKCYRFYPIRNFYNFGFSIIDRISILLKSNEVKKIIAIGQDHLYQLAKEKKGGIILVSHIGNFEFSRIAAKTRFPARLHIIVNHENAKKINSVLKKAGSDLDISIIPVQKFNVQIAVQLADYIEQGDFIVIAGDRTMSENDKNQTEVTFLGQPALFPTGPFLLSKMLSCPIVTLFCLKNKSKYSVYFDLFKNDVNFNNQNRSEALQLLVQEYVYQLESYAIRYPTQWYNFCSIWKKP